MREQPSQRETIRENRVINRWLAVIAVQLAIEATRCPAERDLLMRQSMRTLRAAAGLTPAVRS